MKLSQFITIIMLTHLLSQASCSTVLLISYFRHGARKSLLLNDDGPLTDVGKAQMYIFGQEMRERYSKKLFSPSFKPEEFLIQSSPKGRAMDSLLWHLAGMFPSQQCGAEVEQVRFTMKAPEFPPMKFKKKESYQDLKNQFLKKCSESHTSILPPISISEDYFYHAYNLCHRFIEFRQRMKDLPQLKSLESKYANTYYQAASIINSIYKSEIVPPSHVNLQKLGQILDFYLTQSYIIGDNYSHFFPKQLVKKMEDAKGEYINLLFSDRLVVQLSVSQFFEEIANYLEAKFLQQKRVVGNKDIRELKYMIYAAHDRNIYLILKSILTQEEMNKIGFKGIIPPFASQLLFKIKKAKDQAEPAKNPDAYYVEITLNDKEIEMSKCGPKKCTLTQFIELIRSSVIQNYAEKCTEDI